MGEGLVMTGWNWVRSKTHFLLPGPERDGRLLCFWNDCPQSGCKDPKSVSVG